ncbi:helix-turn-helix transcriptional regulator [Kineosporia sp. A_224]|uniref:ArsR/SmtB family transcription factor n=1 Tax=Kineosporia sp. A_224 TaxID=1962180 RepID=UPI000B4BDE93|nr:metalloregulator ArsR/SmtB family transcription factor [Kineosporia sp. A_224]
MVVRQEPAERTDRLFHALADATRREIVALTLRGDHSVSELAQRFPMSFAAVQKHVAVLEAAGLVVKQRQGRERRVRGNPEALQEVHRLLDGLAQTWVGRMDRIDALLTGATGTGPQTGSVAPQEQETSQ